MCNGEKNCEPRNSSFGKKHRQNVEKRKIEPSRSGTPQSFFHQSVLDQPRPWLKLIRDIRKVYKGQLTYASNWSDDLERIPFWEELDHIGVQAYFPLAEGLDPDLEELEDGWKNHLASLEGLAEKFDRPVLFTEIGYKSTRDAGHKPWEWSRVSSSIYKKISHKTQALCYQALFNTVWKKDWFSGIHIWEWKSRGKSEGMNHGFTLEGKPALNVVARGFSRKMPIGRAARKLKKSERKYAQVNQVP